MIGEGNLPIPFIGVNMKVKNISGKTLNLKSGKCKDGDDAEVDFTEARFLFGQGFAEEACEKRVVKPAHKPIDSKPSAKRTAKADG